MRNLRTQEQIIEKWKGEHDKPLVSICCLAYNHEKFIEDALEGFLNQETDFPFEVLIHDDASTDNTAKIIQEYEAAYKKIIKPIYQTENQYSKGVKITASFNLPRAKGKYVALCEGDDYWTSSKKLQIQVDYMENNPDCALSGHAKKDILLSSLPFNTSIKQREEGRFYTHDVIAGNVMHTSTLVARKAYMKFPDWVNKCRSGDIAFMLILSLNGYGMYFDKDWSVYRHQDGGITKLDRNKIDYLYEQSLYLFNSFNRHTKYKFSRLVRLRVSEFEFYHSLSCLKRLRLVDFFQHLSRSVRKSPKLFFRMILSFAERHLMFLFHHGGFV